MSWLNALWVVGSVVATVVLEQAAHAGLIQFDDEAAWAEAIGGSNRIGFDEFGQVQITDQYAPLGLLFDASQVVVTLNSGTFHDDWGAQNVVTDDSLDITLTQPMRSFAFIKPVSGHIRFFWGGEMIEQAFVSGGQFGGFVLDRPFDAVELRGGAGGSVAVDDIFVPIIPGPGGLGLLAAGGLAGLRPGRRRD